MNVTFAPGGATRVQTAGVRPRGTESDVVSLVGNTPLVHLARMFAGSGVHVFGKLEKANPGGSIKDRAAQAMLESALADGTVVPGRTVVVESSSGNLGIALAQLCAYYGVQFVCVTDPKVTASNLALIKAYGARVDMVTEPDPATGEYLPRRLARVGELLAELPDAWWSNQYANPANPRAHANTMREVLAELPRLDYLVCSTGSCGTLRGCSEFLADHSPGTRIVAVDAVGSHIFDAEPHQVRRLVPGHGAALRPALMRDGLADWLVLVDDRDCIVGCHEARRTESLLLGGSSGAALTAVHRMLPHLEPGATCVVVLPDGGERYLETVFDDRWVAEHLGRLPATSVWSSPAGGMAPLHLTRFPSNSGGLR